MYNEIKIESVFRGTRSALKRDGEWQTVEELEKGQNPLLARTLRAFEPPAVEAGHFARNITGWRRTASGEYAGDLSEAGARDIMARRSRSGGAGPADARGAVRFWLKDGLLLKYEYQLKGTVTGQDGEQVKVDRTTTVQMKEIGSAKIDVPAEARARLSE
jgi:hypothetical protein